jgi:hypothetical protein
MVRSVLFRRVPWPVPTALSFNGPVQVGGGRPFYLDESRVIEVCQQGGYGDIAKRTIREFVKRNTDGSRTCRPESGELVILPIAALR